MIVRRALLGCALLTLGVALTACGGDQLPTIKVSGPAQGTRYNVTITQPPEGLDAKQVRSAMRAVIDTVDHQMSAWQDDSELSRFNAAPVDKWVSVSPALAQLTQTALDIGRKTDGAFDITVQPILAIWGFGPGVSRPDRVPTTDEVAAAREKTGLGLVEVRSEPPALRKKQAGVEVDLAGIAQGYTVDRMAHRLEELDASHYLVELGGELFARGDKTDGDPWQIGVEKPAAGVREVDSVVGLEDAGMTTSGDYRDFLDIDGHRFSHTIDPRTGRPVAHDLRAVTVIADDAMHADAMATALLVMGPQAGLAYANKHDMAALFVQGSMGAYNRFSSNAFQPHVTRQKGAQ